MAGSKFQYDESGGTFFYFVLSFLALVVIPCTYYFWPKDEKKGRFCFSLYPFDSVAPVTVSYVIRSEACPRHDTSAYLTIYPLYECIISENSCRISSQMCRKHDLINCILFDAYHMESWYYPPLNIMNR